MKDCREMLKRTALRAFWVWLRRCKTGRAAACCNIGWHRSLAGQSCPFHVQPVAPAPYVAAIDEWDLLPDA